jgi:hypothetical protein
VPGWGTSGPLRWISVLVVADQLSVGLRLVIGVGKLAIEHEVALTPPVIENDRPSDGLLQGIDRVDLDRRTLHRLADGVLHEELGSVELGLRIDDRPPVVV